MKLYTIPLLALLSFACAKEQPKAKPAPVAITKDADAAKRADVISFAKQYLGTAYCYAGSDPKKGFDCSGFVNFVFKNFGVSLPRSSSGFKDVGQPLKPEDFRVGDVVVFYGYRDRNSVGHVGIICEANGMKSKFIHASSGREMAVIISDLGSAQYTGRFIKCVSVL